MNDTITQIIEEWCDSVENVYKNKDLIKFIKPLLDYVLKIDDKKKEIIYEFICSRKNFTNDRPSTIIMNYMKKTFNEKNEIILKKKFKLVKELGSDGRKNLVKNLKYEVKRVNEIKDKDKQIVKQKTTVKELAETVDKQNKEISKLTQKNDIINKRIEELVKDKKDIENKYNESIKENYEIMKNLLTEKEKTSEKDLCINDLSSQNKILKKQLNHLKEQ
tara:strand:+ start:109 stop:765 length:657 start_codon:yes stop_codon:yes gene_type:complete